MSYTLLIQLIISFLVGGAFITFLSLLAEKANENISGIIMMFPSTVVLGFFFLGYYTSAGNVASVIPATLIPLGIVVLSSVIYINFAIIFSKIKSPKFIQVVFTFLLSSFAWFILASPFAVYKFNNVTIGIVGYLTLISFAHYSLNRKEMNIPPSKFKYSISQILFRATFVGTVIAIVVLFGKTLSPFWGGLFAMYPAATLALLIVLHFYYQPTELFYFFKKAPIGSLSIFVYCISVMLLFPLIGIVWGTLLSYAICLLVSFALISLNRARRHSNTK